MQKFNFKLLPVLFIFSKAAYATVTVTGANESLQETNTLYYAAEPINNTEGFASPSATVLDRECASSSIGTGSCNQNDMIILNISSTGVFTDNGSDKRSVIVIEATEKDGAVKVPIRAMALITGNNNPSGTQMHTCGATGSSCFIQEINDIVFDDSNLDLFFSAHYSAKTTVRVGFLLKDLCKVDDRLENDLEFCDHLDEDDPEKISFDIEVKIRTIDTDADNDVDAVASTNEEKADKISLRIHSRPPGLDNCTQSNLYFPGDKQIRIKTSEVTADVQTGGAPLYRIVAAANLEDSVSSGNAFDNNTIYNTTDFEYEKKEDVEVLKGFQNTTLTSIKNYGLALSVMDKAGLIAAFNSTCSIDPNTAPGGGVQTASIQGFLNSNKCFIASAVYGYEGIQSINLLRKFRDEILSQSSYGKVFIHWYYRWSPNAAQWLLDHPAFKAPIRFLFIPVLAITWLILNPIYLGLIFFTLLLGAFGFVFYRRNNQKVFST